MISSWKVWIRTDRHQKHWNIWCYIYNWAERVSRSLPPSLSPHPHTLDDKFTAISLVLSNSTVFEVSCSISYIYHTWSETKNSKSSVASLFEASDCKALYIYIKTFLFVRFRLFLLDAQIHECMMMMMMLQEIHNVKGTRLRTNLTHTASSIPILPTMSPSMIHPTLSRWWRPSPFLYSLFLHPLVTCFKQGQIDKDLPNKP